MTNFMRFVFAFVLAIRFIAVAQVEPATQPVPASDTAEPSNDKITAALKEALETSTVKAIALTGKHDGFLKNDDIRILLPPNLQAIGKSMRLIASGEQVDELEIGMNRAAEQATPQAKAIFLAAIKKMTFSNPRKILEGNETAASDYFRQVCSEDISGTFTPIVHHALDHLGVIKQYNRVIKSAPGGGVIASDFDLDKYVVEQTLNGIFAVIGAEESRIRKDPAARSTDLEKEVFGGK